MLSFVKIDLLKMEYKYIVLYLAKFNPKIDDLKEKLLEAEKESLMHSFFV